MGFVVHTHRILDGLGVLGIGASELLAEDLAQN